ncbi:MAG TPA: response regulator transcription factor [Aggregatilineales bacterium]|nr:response regulator transcription factor [Aggregatilineales bacterium]
MDALRRLLLVGNEGALSGWQDRLLARGFHLSCVPSGTVALRDIHTNGLPHLLIVRLELPDMSGLDFCRSLCEKADIPIIMLAQQDAPGLAVRALRHADDFLREPIDPEELIMRVQRVLSRVGNFSYAGARPVQVCDFLEVDFVRRRVFVDGHERQLTPTENALLQVLVKHCGEVVSVETLIERLWRNGVHLRDRNALRVHMHRLRQKLERTRGDAGVIRTERGIGYTLVVC